MFHWTERRVRAQIGVCVLAYTLGAYLVFNQERVLTRIQFVDPVFVSDIILGALFVVLVFEATRRGVDSPVVV